MRYFTDSALLLLYSILAFFYVALDQTLVFSLLFAVILVCITYTSQNRYFLTGCYLTFAVCAFAVSDLVLFFPLLLYLILHTGFLLSAAALIPVSIFLFLHGNQFPAVFFAAGMFGFLLAFFLWSYTGKYNELDQNFRKIQDDSEEHALLLSEKNKVLLEKQNYEIYAATLRERNRIAREIHDNVGHVLSRSILMTGALKTINKEDSVAPLLGNLEDSLNSAMNSIRSSVHDLHDDAVNLEDAIRGLVKDFSFCPVTLTYDMSRQIPGEVKYSLISITKEGLSNVMRHSNASSVTLLLREHPGLYQFCMEDNGTGNSGNFSTINRTETASNGMGLSNIRDRVKTLGGTVQITSGQGFRIFITIPKQSF